jgi:hypothetical protein
LQLKELEDELAQAKHTKNQLQQESAASSRLDAASPAHFSKLELDAFVNSLLAQTPNELEQESAHRMRNISETLEHIRQNLRLTSQDIANSAHEAGGDSTSHILLRAEPFRCCSRVTTSNDGRTARCF